MNASQVRVLNFILWQQIFEKYNTLVNKFCVPFCECEKYKDWGCSKSIFSLCVTVITNSKRKPLAEDQKLMTACGNTGMGNNTFTDAQTCTRPATSLWLRHHI